MLICITKINVSAEGYNGLFEIRKDVRKADIEDVIKEFKQRTGVLRISAYEVELFGTAGCPNFPDDIEIGDTLRSEVWTGTEWRKDK